MTARTCPHCGEPVAPDRNICKACGADIREASEPAAPKPTVFTPAIPEPARRSSLVIYLIIGILVAIAVIAFLLVRGGN